MKWISPGSFVILVASTLCLGRCSVALRYFPFNVALFRVDGKVAHHYCVRGAVTNTSNLSFADEEIYERLYEHSVLGESYFKFKPSKLKRPALLFERADVDTDSKILWLEITNSSTILSGDSLETLSLYLSDDDENHLKKSLRNFEQHDVQLQLAYDPYPNYFGLRIGIHGYTLAVVTVLLASITTIIKSEKLIAQVIKRRSENHWLIRYNVLLIIAFLLVLCISFTLQYCFGEQLVYLDLASILIIIVIFGTHLFAVWAARFCKRAGQIITVWKCTFTIAELCFFPIFVALAVVWIVYRKQRSDIEILHNALLILGMAGLLSATILIPSMKNISVLYILMMIFDVFFVFITRFIINDTSKSWTDAWHGKDIMVSLMRRTESDEIRLNAFTAYVTSYFFGCKSGGNALMHGDAFIPGFLFVYVALFDTAWKIRFKRNLIASLIGFILGLICTEFALLSMPGGQPALLYLCPCSLLFCLLSSLVFGGRLELRRLWKGVLPGSAAKDSDGKVQLNPQA